MTCAIMQPTYIPWLGYFDMIDKVDVFVIYDDVQLARRSWQVRNRIKGANGEIWLTIPIKKQKSRDETIIKEAEINYSDKWQHKHLKTIELNYRKALFFKDIFPFIKDFYKPVKFLSEFNSSIIIRVAQEIGIETEIIFSSDLDNIEGSKDERLVNICKKLGADQYLSPQGSANYINRKNKGGEFIRNNINLVYHNYEHPEYSQLHGEFIPYMGVYDLLLNENTTNALDIIRRGRRKDLSYKDL